MAKRRCISIDFFESEKYINLTNEEKVLYTALILRSDDEGVVINPNIALMLNNINHGVLHSLTEKELLYKEDDMYIIKHWNIHNKISPSKKCPSLYQSILEKFRIKLTGEYTRNPDHNRL